MNYRTLGKGVAIFFGAVLLVSIVNAIADDESPASSSGTASANTATAEGAQVMHLAGETVSSSRFAVTLHGFEFVNGLEINTFAGLEPVEGSFYVILDATWENIDDETRSILSSGDIIFDWEGQRFTVDSSEIVFADGWGFLETLAPFQKHRTRVAFSVPFKSGMRIAWVPVRGEYFYLQELETQPL